MTEIAALPIRIAVLPGTGNTASTTDSAAIPGFDALLAAQAAAGGPAAGPAFAPMVEPEPADAELPPTGKNLPDAATRLLAALLPSARLPSAKAAPAKTGPAADPAQDPAGASEDKAPALFAALVAPIAITPTPIPAPTMTVPTGPVAPAALPAAVTARKGTLQAEIPTPAPAATARPAYAAPQVVLAAVIEREVATPAAMPARTARSAPALPVSVPVLSASTPFVSASTPAEPGQFPPIRANQVSTGTPAAEPQAPVRSARAASASPVRDIAIQRTDETLASTPAPILATPLQTPAETAPTPTTATPPARERIDFATLVDSLARAREDASAGPVAVSLTHGEFGKVSLHFDHRDEGLSVALSSPDPAFAPAVAAASEAASGAMNPDTPRSESQPQSRATTTTQQGGDGSATDGNTARQDTPRQTTGANANPGPARSQRARDEDASGGIFA